MEKRNLVFEILISACMFIGLLTLIFKYFDVKKIDIVKAFSDNFEMFDIDVDDYEDRHGVEELTTPRTGIEVVGDLYDIDAHHIKHVEKLKSFSIAMLILSWIAAAATIVLVWLLEDKLKYIVVTITSSISFLAALALYAFVPNIAGNAIVEAIEKHLIKYDGIAYIVETYIRKNLVESFGNFSRDVMQKSLAIGYWLLLIFSLFAMLASVIGMIIEIRSNRQPVKAFVAAKIMGLSGIYEGAELEVGEAIIMGRDPSVCNLVIKGDKISRRHCKVEFNSATGKYVVTDYSSNGTYLIDGKRLDENVPVELERGSIIKLGIKGDTFRLG